MYCFFYLDDNGINTHVQDLESEFGTWWQRYFTVTWSRYLLFAYKSENYHYRLTRVILHCFVFTHMHLQAHHCKYYSLWIFSFGFPLKSFKNAPTREIFPCSYKQYFVLFPNRCGISQSTFFEAQHPRWHAA